MLERETSVVSALRRVARTSLSGPGVAFAALSLGLCLALPGCADSPGAAYPSLSSINDLGKTLTPDEQKKAIADLRKTSDSSDPTKDAPKQ